MQTLLKQLEPMCHSDRMRFMVQYGKNPDVEVLAQLEQGNVYERQLALASCFSSHDAAHVQRALQDASRIIRGLAGCLAPFVLTQEQLLESLRIVPSKMRLVVLHKLQQRKKAMPIADALLKSFMQLGLTRDATAILGFASLEVIEEHLPLLELASTAELARLARNQPNLVADWLEQRFNLDEQNRRLNWQFNAVLPRIAEKAVARVSPLLRLMQRGTHLGWLKLQPLVQRHPKVMAAFALEQEEPSSLDFSAVAHRLELSQVLALQAQHPATLQRLEAHFSKFASAFRPAIFQACKSEWMNSDGLIAVETLRLLPRELCQQQAQIHLEHPVLQSQTLQRLPYASLLDWDEAKTIFEPSFKHPKPEYRSVAIPNLIYTARYNRLNYNNVLEFVRFRKNEQDPVRLTMLSAIGRLPPAAWQPEQLEELGLVLQDALNAADLSYQTGLVAEQIVFGLLPFYPQWAAKWLGILVKERGQIGSYNFGQRISDAQAQVLAVPLLPVLKAWETQERESNIIALLFYFGKRLKVLPDFLELATRLVRQAIHSGTSQSALQLIAKHDIPRFNALVPELLKADKSWAIVPTVYQYLHRHRQDLLSPFLGQSAYKGRFSTGKTRFVLPLSNGFHRWNPKQQETFVQTLEQVAKDNDHSIPAVQFVLVQLASIPNARTSTIRSLSAIHISRLAIRDSALRALGRLDEANGLEPLLKALEDDRARIAIYALRRLLLAMPPQQALDLLRQTPVERVTVGKEVMRLIGELRTQAAWQQLLIFSQQNLHRDVRVALLRALWDYLEQPETWDVFQAAARDEDPAIADGVIRIPTERLSAFSQTKLVEVLAALIAHPDPDVRLETLRRCRFLPVTDTEQKFVQPMQKAILSSDPNQTRIALEAFFYTSVKMDTVLIATSFEMFLSSRLILQEAIEAYLNLYRSFFRSQQANRLLGHTQAILRVLEKDSLTLHLQSKMAVYCLPSQEAALFMVNLAEQQHLHADVYLTVLEVIRDPSRIGRQVSTFEQVWRDHPNELLRRLALQALISSASNQRGSLAAWKPAQLVQLEKYRTDPSSMVAAAAQFTFPVAKLEE